VKRQKGLTPELGGGVFSDDQHAGKARGMGNFCWV
jgi:hypothetical protein